MRSKRASYRLAKSETLPRLLLARTDGRTNERPNHLPETSSVPYRTGEIEESSAWELFINQIDPAAVEAERFGKPSKGERPGSPEDIRMRYAHDVKAGMFWLKRRSPGLTKAERHLIVAEAVAYDRRRNAATRTPAQINQYKQNRKAAA